jgi:hypothetical protein
LPAVSCAAAELWLLHAGAEIFQKLTQLQEFGRFVEKILDA